MRLGAIEAGHPVGVIRRLEPSERIVLQSPVWCLRDRALDDERFVQLPGGILPAGEIRPMQKRLPARFDDSANGRDDRFLRRRRFAFRALRGEAKEAAGNETANQLGRRPSPNRRRSPPCSAVESANHNPTQHAQKRGLLQDDIHALSRGVRGP
jgi:hypothetical protein